MGEIADAMLQGLFCQLCGELIDGFETGYPRTCVGCGGSAAIREVEVADDRQPCPFCDKRKRNVAAHIEAKHSGR